MSFPDVQTHNGSHVVLPWSELAEINRLVARRNDIRKPIKRIVMLAPDAAKVHSGLTGKTGDLETEFRIRKKAGKWFIDESSIKEGEVLVITEPLG
jgi:hypothetical protein